MKKIFTLSVGLLFAFSALAQEINYMPLFNFEDGVDTTIWMPFANGTGTKKDLNVVVNPLKSGVNNTDSVLWMHLYTGAESWVGYYVDLDTLEIEGIYGAIGFEEDAHMMSLMVYKTISSSVRIKVERSITGSSVYTAPADTNDVVNEWEFMEFDFKEKIGHYFARITIFPDGTPKANRTAELDVYVDNIGIQDATNTSIKDFEGAQMKLYPNPVDFRMAVVYPGMTGVRILNMNGQEIRTLVFGPVNSKVIEVGDLKTGTYFITAMTPKGHFTMPFIKK